MITAEALNKKAKALKDKQTKLKKQIDAAFRGEAPIESTLTMDKVEEQVLKDMTLGDTVFLDKLKNTVIKSLKKNGYKVFLVKMHIHYLMDKVKTVVKPATFFSGATYRWEEKFRTWYEYRTVVAWTDNPVDDNRLYIGYGNIVEKDITEL